MSENKEYVRGRFGNILNYKQAPTQRWEWPGDRYGATGYEVARTIDAKDLGFSVVSLDPGKRSCPYHFHHSEEEMFFVLEGRALLRQGDTENEEQIEVSAGDFISFPAGTEIAHQFSNTSDGPFVYLALSNIVPGDVCEYPDSDKILVRKTRMILRREPKLEYFDGEV